MTRIPAPRRTVALLIVASACAAAGGCLNPRPEELPSETVGLGDHGAEGENSLPEAPSNANGGVVVDPNLGTPPASEGASGSEDMPAPADAGAPDAGLGALSTDTGEPVADPELDAETSESPE